MRGEGTHNYSFQQIRPMGLEYDYWRLSGNGLGGAGRELYHVVHLEVLFSVLGDGYRKVTPLPAPNAKFDSK